MVLTIHKLVLHCTGLYWIVLHCTGLYCTVLDCTALYRYVLHRTELYSTLFHCSVLVEASGRCTDLDRKGFLIPVQLPLFLLTDLKDTEPEGKTQKENPTYYYIIPTVQRCASQCSSGENFT